MPNKQGKTYIYCKG